MNLKRLILTVTLSVIVIASAVASVFYKQKSDQPVLDPHEAAIVLVAPDQVGASQLVVLDVSGSIADSYKWEVVPASPNFMVIDGGKRAVFSAASGEYLFIVAGAKDGTVDVKIHKLKIEATVPSNTLKAKVMDWAKQINSPSKRDDLIRLSQSFSSIASTVAVGGLTPENILDATKASNQKALGASLSYWQPLFDQLAADLKARAEAGELTDAESHVKAWNAIAEGLAEYAKTLPVQKKTRVAQSANTAVFAVALKR